MTFCTDKWTTNSPNTVFSSLLKINYYSMCHQWFKVAIRYCSQVDQRRNNISPTLVDEFNSECTDSSLLFLPFPTPPLLSWLTFQSDPHYSPDAGTALLSPMSYKRCNTEFYYVGKIPRILIGCPSLQRRVLLKWFYSPRAVGTPSSEVHALYRVHF